MANPLTTAAAAIRRAAEGLAGNPTHAERRQLLRLLEQTALLLEASGRRSLRAAALAERVAHLERVFADLPPGQRRNVVCQRLGICRSKYYELRKSTN